MPSSRTKLAARALRLLPRKGISRTIGHLADLSGPSDLVEQGIERFCSIYSVDIGEAIVPDGGFSSFNDFFTRRLRPGARPICDEPGVIVSPADGRVEDRGEVRSDSTFLVKGKEYSAAELLGDASMAEEFNGGQFAIVYLSPRDYHRVHAPISGPVVHARHVYGTLWPVNSIGLDHVPNLFSINERVAIHQKGEEFGHVASVMVGAMGVGRIGLSFDDILTNVGNEPCARNYADGEQTNLDRGDELGVFYLGSTVVMFIAPHYRVRFSTAPGESVRMGEKIAVRESE